MTDDRKSGIALIVGSLGTILTMAIHPHGTGDLNADQYRHLAATSAAAHTLAIVSLAIFLLGALGLTRRLSTHEVRLHADEPDRLALSALVACSVALVAILIAAAVSGFIVPRMLLMMVHDEPSALPMWHIAVAAVFQFNQAFARIYAVAACAAIILWSASALRNGGLTRLLATYGCIAAPILIALIFASHLQLDVHGMGAVVLVQSIWFITAGAQLYRAGHPTLGNGPIVV